MQANSITIVRIQEENYCAFSKLLEWRRTGSPDVDTRAYQTDRVQNFLEEHQILNSDLFYIFAAQRGDEFVGYINTVLIPKPDPRLGMMYIDELWVPEEYRGQGIAELLMREVFRVGQEKNLWRIRLYVGADNPAARRFYQKMGYEEKGDAIFCEVDVKDVQL